MNAPVSGTTAPVSGTNAPVSGTNAPVSGTNAPVSGTHAGQSGTQSGTQGMVQSGTQGASSGTQVSGTSPGKVVTTATTEGPLADLQNLQNDATFVDNANSQFATGAGVAKDQVNSTHSTQAKRRRLVGSGVMPGRSLSAVGIMTSIFTITLNAGQNPATISDQVSNANMVQALKTAIQQTPGLANVTVSVTVSDPTTPGAPTPAPSPANHVGGACGSQLTSMVLLAILSSLFF